MSYELKCIGCQKVRKVSADVGDRVIVCKSCNGLLVPAHRQLPMNEHGEVDISDRRLSVACRVCSALVDVPAGLSAGAQFSCPRCHNSLTLPRPQLRFALAPIAPSEPVNGQSSAPEPPHFKPSSLRNLLPSAPLPSAPLPSAPLPSAPLAAEGLFESQDTNPPRLAQLLALDPAPGWSSDTFAPPRPQPANADFSTNFGDPPVSDKRSDSLNLDSLQSVSLWQSWRTGKLRLPNYLVKGRGKQLEAIVARFVAAIARENLQGVQIAMAGEQANVRDLSRPVRVLSYQGSLHLNATDVLFRSEGNDLFVKFQSAQRTWISYLRIGLYATSFLALLSVAMLIYLYGTGAYSGWSLDYAQKHSIEKFSGIDKHAFYQKAITQGYYTFDNIAYVNEMKSNGGEALLLEFTKLVSEQSQQLQQTESTNSTNLGSALESFSNNMILFGIKLVLDQARFDTGALLAVDRLNAAYGPDQFFVWENRDNVVFLMGIGQKMMVHSLNYTQDVDLQSFFIDFEGHEELHRRSTKAFANSVTFHAPWSPFKLFFSDPKLAMYSLGGPTTIFAMLIGGALYFLPMTILRWPCRILGWPTFEEFMNMSNSRNAWVERVLSDTLMNDFGVLEHDRFNVMSQ